MILFSYLLYTFHTYSDTHIGDNKLKTIHCYHCQHPQVLPGSIRRHSTCSKCENDLKICYHCAFYDKNSYHQCRESEAEWVKDKEQANFCDYFSASNNMTSTKETDDTTKKLNVLFNDIDDKKKPSSKNDTLDDLEKLFQ